MARKQNPIATLARLAGLALLAVFLLSGTPRTQLRAQPAKHAAAGPVESALVESAIDAAATYLVDACQADGRFRYRVDLNPHRQLDSQYNMLRHAGAIYALAQYHQHRPNNETGEVLRRAGTYLKQAIQPVAGNRHLAALWSLPEMVGANVPRQAKLGGTGLGLVALLSIEQVQPGFTTTDELRRLGRFLLYMQKADGSFYSKYYPEGVGRDDRWASMYYPGEAALGLLMLHEKDPQRQWLGGAAKALAALARSGSQRPKTLPDQWVLLATQRMMPHFASTTVLVSRDLLLEHARRTCRDMLDDQSQVSSPSIRGCYTADGRTCPSATRLEGLLAALQFIPAEERSLRKELQDSVDAGIRFLVHSQIKEGPFAGGLPRVAPQFSGLEGGKTPMDKHPTEIRIDYVQHALSALLAYEIELRLRGM